MAYLSYVHFIQHVQCSTTMAEHAKRQNIPSEEIEPASELDSDTAEILELSSQEYEIMMINMLRALRKKGN